MDALGLLEQIDTLMQQGFAGDAKKLLEAELPGVRKAGDEQPIAEAGRVLSSKNEASLRCAHNDLAGVLGKLPQTEPATESASIDLDGDLVPLVERAMKDDGIATIKLIAPGRGSSGVYSHELLERDGPKVFRRGLKMYADHPTPSEEADRPERSVKDLAGELVSDARWLAEGPAGPGLYAEAKVFQPFRPLVEELAPHIGVSIRARGRVRPGKFEGQSAPIVEELVSAQSADFVTEPGAGGKVLQLLESARSRALAQSPTESGKAPGGNTMAVDEKDFADLREAFQSFKANTEARQTELTTKLSEAEGRATKAEQALLLREAQDIALEVLEKVQGLPEMTRKRIAESAAKNPPITKTGELNRDVFDPLVEAAARKEMAYLAKVLRSGEIRGMGSSNLGADEALDPAKVRAQLVESFRGMGMSERAAQLAAEGRVA